jgi:NitT/TauT family transport system substrate-binding protein
VRFIKVVTFIVIGCLVLTACQDNASDEHEEKMDTVRVASWSQEITEQVNLLAADEKPFFKDEKIHLTFVPGSGSSDAIKNMLAGNADIAFADAGSFFSALDQGEDLVAIYNIYPQNVFNVVSLKENKITEPEDLKGKTIGVYSLASGTRQNLLILLYEAGLTENDVEIVETGVLNFAPLMQEQVDATAATDTGLLLGKERGLGEVDVIEVKDYLNFSSDLFVVTREMLEENADVLTRFLHGFQSSAEWMINHPEEAAELAVEYAIDGQDEQLNKKIIELRNEASQSEHALGYTDTGQMQQAADMYQELGLIESKLDMEKHITNELLD